MAATKVTFTPDHDTISRLQEAATRMTMRKSEVVRVAIAEYYDRIGRLSESERLRMLRVLDDLATHVPTRSDAQADRELRSIRGARRAGGRRHAS
jgi:hypothetical protein